MQKNVASQSWVVFGFYESNNVATIGDAANITARISKDHAAAANTDDTNPTEIEDGYYRFALTQAETNADHLLLMPESNTSGVAVIGVPGTYTTTPAYFADLGIESDGDLTKVNELHGHTAQTGDTYPIANNATYGNSAIRTAVNTVDDNVDLVLTDTNTLQTEWADGGRLDLILDARASQSSVNTVDGNVDSILADTNTLQTEWADGGRLDLILDARASQASVNTIDGNVDSILTDTNTLQTEWADGGRLDLILDGRASQTSVDTIDGNVDSILADTNTLQTEWADGGRLDLILDTVAVDVAGLDGAAMRGTDNAALAATALSNTVWTAAKAAFLDAAVSSRSTFNTSSDTVTLANGAHGGAAATITLSDYSDFQGSSSLTAQQVWEYATRGLTNTVTLADGAHGGASASITLSDYTDFQGAASGFSINTAVPTDGPANSLGHYLRVIDAVVGGKTNADTGTANQVQFLDRDGSTVVRTITYGSDDGSRTASTI